MRVDYGCVVSKALFAAALFAVPSVWAQQYEVVQVGSLGGTFTRALGVNDAGLVVGTSTNVDETTLPFVWEAGTLQQLPLLDGGTTGDARGVNNAGVIVGSSDNASAQQHAVKWTRNPDGSWGVTDLGTLGGNFSHATAINQAGQITGASQIAPPPPPMRQTNHAFLLDATMMDLGVLSFPSSTFVFSEGTALNTQQHVVGYSYPVLSSELNHAFFYDGSTMIDLTPTGNRPRMNAYGINDSDLIVGEIADRTITGGPSKAFYTMPHAALQYVPLLPGHTDNSAFAVNNAGAIVGTSYNNGDNTDQRGFLFTADGVFDLNALADHPTVQVSEANAISPNGTIAGSSFTATGGSLGLLLRVGGRCVADFDDGSGTGTPDGGVTIDDLLYYLTLFADGSTRADVDNGTSTGTPDGGVTIDDLLYYLLRYSAGC